MIDSTELWGRPFSVVHTSRTYCGMDFFGSSAYPVRGIPAPRAQRSNRRRERLTRLGGEEQPDITGRFPDISRENECNHNILTPQHPGSVLSSKCPKKSPAEVAGPVFSLRWNPSQW